MFSLQLLCVCRNKPVGCTFDFSKSKMSVILLASLIKLFYGYKIALTPCSTLQTQYSKQSTRPY